MAKNSSSKWRMMRRHFILRVAAAVVFFSVTEAVYSAHSGREGVTNVAANSPSDAAVQNIQDETTRRISGTITDENGEPLMGVNVKIKGTSQGTTTDLSGKFVLKVPLGSPTLVITYIGCKEEQIVVGKESVLKIKMKEDSRTLGEVVVTAMGIERKAESLTYATQTVGGNELTRAKEANLINSLQGKSAGLTITPSAGGAGSASKILLRGNASILGNNSPLIVVDGVPMSNSISGATGVDGGAALGYGGSSESSDALSQLNPDDIASMTILKGANSAALYGSAASNGVIMINTKKGQQGVLRVDVSSSTMFESPLMLPRFQNNYGGMVSVNTSNSTAVLARDSWGLPISRVTDAQMDEYKLYGINLTRNPYDIANFFRMGYNLNHSIAVSGGTEKVQNYFSYGNTTANGIFPNNEYERHNVMFRENFSLFNNKLKIDVSGNYIYQKMQNRYVGGGNQTNALPSLYIGSRGLDLDYYRNNYQSMGEWKSEPYQIYQSSGNGANNYDIVDITSTLKGPLQTWPYSVISESNNPWWLTGMNSGVMTTNKLFGSIGLNYQIYKDLSLQVRFKYDRYMEENTNKTYANTRVLKASNDDRGQLVYKNNYVRDIFGDALLNYNKQIKDFRLGVNAGASYMNSKGDTHAMNQAATVGRPPYKTENFSVNHFEFSGLALGTGSGMPSSNWEWGMFTTAQLSYKEFANIEGSYREDWYRAFTQLKQYGIKQHYGYYSFGGNILVNKIVEMPRLFNQVKVRASYSEVGNSIPNTLMIAAMRKNEATGALTMDNLMTTTNLKPEKTASTEVGFDLSLFDYALNMDFTYYNAILSNQYMIKRGTGGKNLAMNSGKVLNRGVESTISYNWKINRNFAWKTGVNFSFNVNQIQSVGKDKNGKEKKHEIALSGDGSPIGGGLKIKFIKGGAYGDLYVNDFQRKVSGELFVSKNGSPTFDMTSTDRYVGNLNSKYHLGWNNTFTYKDFSFYFLIDGRIGGKVISYTEAFMDQKGVSERSGAARDYALANNIFFKNDPNTPGMYITDNGREYPVSVRGYYEAIGGNCGADYVYDATNFRLREVSAGYTFRNLFGASKNLTVSLNARNLFFIYKNAPVDPDVSLSATNSLSGIDLFNLPTTRSYGFSIKATF